MDERYEALCEIGDLVLNAGRSDLVETYYELLCEHYPADILTALALELTEEDLSSEEESDEEPGMLAGVVDIEPEPAQPEPPLKEMGEEAHQYCGEEDDKLEDLEHDYGSDCSSVAYSSEEELVEEEIIVKKDENGFLSLA